MIGALRPAAVAALFLALVLHLPVAGRTQAALPASLSDGEFWSLVEQMSEPDRFFRSNSGSPDNLLSNERNASQVAAELASRVTPGGVYLGVGPEQNFTYMAAMRPRIAFITDIRRGNLHLQLMYKALFELSANRAEFAARLFNRRPQRALSATATAGALMAAHPRAGAVDQATFTRNFAALIAHLTTTRKFPLSSDDRSGIQYVYENFYKFGTSLNYHSSINRRTAAATYEELMTATDGRGVERSYLATEENFAVIKSLQSKNLVVPIVGDFAGPKALRAVGSYLRDRGATVGAFYLSNVEMYLQQNRVWPAFCANVASMPIDASSVFIRPDMQSSSLNPIVDDTRRCPAR